MRIANSTAAALPSLRHFGARRSTKSGSNGSSRLPGSPTSPVEFSGRDGFLTADSAHNAVFRHLKTSRAGQPAIIWEGEDGAVVRLSYAELAREVELAAVAL